MEPHCIHVLATAIVAAIDPVLRRHGWLRGPGFSSAYSAALLLLRGIDGQQEYGDGTKESTSAGGTRQAILA